jgi:glutamate racemase
MIAGKRSMASAGQNHPGKTRSIVVTDSGMGGLSVFNAIANQLDKESPWQFVKLVYVNAWPAPHRGYNHFVTLEKRARVFDNALRVMARYNPDEILIACNTLSVIFSHTHFSKSSGVKVQGIVDHGVQMVHESLSSDPGSVAIILGTPTTINAKTHEKELVGLGISEDRIINLACTNLAGRIEREPFSKTVKEMITKYVQQAATALDNFSGNVFAALCCTHFGYRRELFAQAFADTVDAKVTMLDPNIRMVRQAVPSVDGGRLYRPQIEMQMVSKARWSTEQVGAYEKLLGDVSHVARNALHNYRHVPDLFSVD